MTIRYANIYRPNCLQTILRLNDITTFGRENTVVNSPAEVRAFLAAHPEVQAVMFSDTRLPRRAVPVEKLTDAMLRRCWGGAK